MVDISKNKNPDDENWKRNSQKRKKRSPKLKELLLKRVRELPLRKKGNLTLVLVSRTPLIFVNQEYLQKMEYERKIQKAKEMEKKLREKRER
jgi:hypothetical protein